MSGASKSSRAAATRSSDSTPEAMRSGQPSACAIGVRMSGLPSWARTDPSTYSHHRMHDALRVYDHFNLPGFHPEQNAGLDQLKTLVHQCRRIDRNLPSHAPARMRARFVGCHPSHLGPRHPQERPPEAAGQRALRPLQARPVEALAGMHWKIALCSLSIGMSVAPPTRAAETSSAPPTTSDSLLASKTRLPAEAAAIVDGRPAAPTIAAMTTSTSASHTASTSAARPLSTRVDRPLARSAAPSSCAACRILEDRETRAVRRCTARRADGDPSVPRVYARGNGRRGARRRRACSQPMLPACCRVRRCRSCRPAECHQAEHERGCRGGQAIDAVEHAAVTRQEAAAASVRPVRRLNMLSTRSSNDRDQRDDQAESELTAIAADRGAALRPRRQSEAASMPDIRPSHVLPGLIAGASLRRPKRPTSEERADVCGGRQDQEEAAATHDHAAG